MYAQPSLAASDLRERATPMTKLKTGHSHFAKNRTLSRCVYRLYLLLTKSIALSRFIVRTNCGGGNRVVCEEGEE